MYILILFKFNYMQYTIDKIFFFNLFTKIIVYGFFNIYMYLC